MPRNQFNIKIKTAIIEAAKEARAKNGTMVSAFDPAFDAAKKAGYKGSLQGIAKMLWALDKKVWESKSKRGRKPGRKPERKPGRPVGRPAGRPKAGVASIDAMVAVLVKERVSATLDRVIEILQAARE